MTRFVPSFILLTFIAIIPVQSFAQTGMLDLIPHDALYAIALKSVNETGKHLDKFSNDTNIRPGMQPSMGMKMALGWIGVTSGLDNDAPIALILPDARKLKNKSYSDSSQDFLDNIVLALPFSNLNQLARCFNASPKKLKAGELVKGKGTVFGKYFKVHHKHLIISNRKEKVEEYFVAKSVATKMTATQIKHANGGDILLHIGTRSWGKDWDTYLKELENGNQQITREIDNFDSRKHASQRAPYTKENYIALKKLLIQFTKLMEFTDFGIFTVRYNKGLGTSAMTIFRDDQVAERKKLLTEFSGSKLATSLKGLPNDNILLAFGHAAYSEDVEMLLRLSSLLFIDEWRFVPRKSMADYLRKKRFLPFSKQFLKTNHARGAIFLNRGKMTKGWISLTSIIEPKETENLLVTLQKNAIKINPKGTDLHLDNLNENVVKATSSSTEIDKLILALGDTDFEVRTAATNKLIKIGNAAMEALQKATKHRDKEIALRAEQLISQMSEDKTNSRRVGLPAIFPVLADATYIYTPEAETIEGQKVDIISLESTKSTSASEEHFKQLLGTNWKHIRLVHLDNKIIFHWGSDTAALQQTLKNIQAHASGLAAHVSTIEHHNFSSHPQKLQLHFSLTNLVPFFKEEGQEIMKRRKEKFTPFSSASITIDEKQLQIDTWVPSADLKNALKGQDFNDMNSIIRLFMRF